MRNFISLATKSRLAGRRKREWPILKRVTLAAIAAAAIAVPVALTAAPADAATTTTHTRLYYVVDGDTIRLPNGEYVRLIGINAPEKTVGTHNPGWRATLALQRCVWDHRYHLTLSNPSSVMDRDHYGRLLRYVGWGSVDCGLRQIKTGHAVPRYDSTDGYQWHPRQARYHRAAR